MDLLANPGTTAALPDEQWCSDFATEHSPDGVVLADPQWRVVWANAAALALLGHDPEQVRGLQMVDFVHSDDLSHALGAVSEASRNDGHHEATRMRVRGATGEFVDCRITANTIDRPDGTWFVLGMRSVADEDAIENRRRRLRGLATTFYVDCASMEWVDEPQRSAALLSALGAVLDADHIDISELVGDGTRLDHLAVWDRSGPSPADAKVCTTTAPLSRQQVDAVRLTPCDYSTEGGEATVRVWLESPSDSDGMVSIHLGDHPEQWDDANADVVSLMCSSLMATIRRCARERALAMAATRDPLTGLFNRSAMEERLEELIAASDLGTGGLAVFFADLNDFKALNDSRGHQAGDEVLRRVADGLRSSIRPGDVAARIGGDEFVVVMMTGHRPIERLTARIRASVEAAVSDFAEVGVAIGSITVGRDESPDEVLRRADAAMYADKRRQAIGSGTGSRADTVVSALDVVIESMSIMLVVDENARLVTATEAAYTAFGFDRSSSAGLDVLSLIHPDDLPMAMEAFAEVLANDGPADPMVLSVVDANGRWHLVQVAATNQLANPSIRGIVYMVNETGTLKNLDGITADGEPTKP